MADLIRQNDKAAYEEKGEEFRSKVCALVQNLLCAKTVQERGRI